MHLVACADSFFNECHNYNYYNVNLTKNYYWIYLDSQCEWVIHQFSSGTVHPIIAKNPGQKCTLYYESASQIIT